MILTQRRYWQQKKKQRLTFEYILIENVNDTPDQARALAQHATRLGAKVNLIPYNKVEGLTWKRPSIARQDAFLHILKAARVDATIPVLSRDGNCPQKSAA